jgi:DNA-binding GntR family transcriptional regulator
MATDETTAAPQQLTLWAAAQIRGLIVDRVLLPGEKIRQTELAERVGVSRSPLREALRTLESEGVVSYETNRGYVVARLEPTDLGEIYRMRSLLESELLRTIEKPSRATLQQLSKDNSEMIAAIEAGDTMKVMEANRAFHFTIFDLSPMRQYKREIHRLWQLSEGYRSWWWRLPDAKTRIDTEHKQIIAALRQFDLDQLVAVSNAHRVGGHELSLAQIDRPHPNLPPLDSSVPAPKRLARGTR